MLGYESDALSDDEEESLLHERKRQQYDFKDAEFEGSSASQPPIARETTTDVIEATGSAGGNVVQAPQSQPHQPVPNTASAATDTSGGAIGLNLAIDTQSSGAAITAMPAASVATGPTVPHPNIRRPDAMEYENLQHAIWQSLVSRQSQSLVTGVEVGNDVVVAASAIMRAYYERRAANAAARGKGSKGIPGYVTDYLCRLKSDVSRLQPALFGFS